MTLCSRPSTLAVPLFLVGGCNGGWTPQDDTSEEGVEVDCDDGIDGDADSLVDCDDPDCDGLELCTWPTALDLDVRFDFDANPLAEFAGVQDCLIHYTSPLLQHRPMDCAACDRVFRGPFHYVFDDCPPDEGNPRPTEGGYGLRFDSDTAWHVYFRLDEVWTSMGTATDDGSGTFVFDQTDPVNYEQTEVGTLRTTFRFSLP
ncbi:MAG: hypothetical protein JRI25_16360 [Deltaproteobacteria bacterium]|nr:hypothetical protein [Deltaproteobacteria bacterium]